MENKFVEMIWDVIGLGSDWQFCVRVAETVKGSLFVVKRIGSTVGEFWLRAVPGQIPTFAGLVPFNPLHPHFPYGFTPL